MRVILEVMNRREAGSFGAFQQRVLATKPAMKDKALTYRTIYGEVLTLDTAWKKAPTINGKPVDYAPKMVYDSPFLKSHYDSGVITITKGKRRRVLDFNKLIATESVR